jgi:nucleoside-diphosphate-sugar epimerase
MAENYLITGAQGCIGSWIVKALAERGDNPIVFDHSNDARRLAAIMDANHLKRVRFVVGDITNRSAVLSALQTAEALRVVHLAGLQVPSCKLIPLEARW